MSCFIPTGSLSPEPAKKKAAAELPTHNFDVDKFEKEHTQVAHPRGGDRVLGRSKSLDVQGFEERKLRKRQVTHMERQQQYVSWNATLCHVL